MNHTPPTENWQDCPSGTLRDISLSQRRATTKKQVASISAVGLVSCLLVGVAYMNWAGDANQNPTMPSRQVSQRFVCSDVLQRMDGYLVKNLPSEEMDKVKGHLRKCPKCSNKYQLRAEELGVDFSLALRTIRQGSWKAFQVLLAAAR